MQADVESGKHPPAMTKLLERQLNECGEWPYLTIFLISCDLCSAYHMPNISVYRCSYVTLSVGVLFSQVLLELQSLVHLTVLWLS